MNSKQLMAATLIGLGSVTSIAHAVPDAPANWEKCAGVSKAGLNDCGALDGSHACAGQATQSNVATEWVYVPEGTCAKIGGTVAKIKPAK